MGLTDGF